MTRQGGDLARARNRAMLSQGYVEQSRAAAAVAGDVNDAERFRG